MDVHEQHLIALNELADLRKKLAKTEQELESLRTSNVKAVALNKFADVVTARNDHVEEIAQLRAKLAETERERGLRNVAASELSRECRLLEAEKAVLSAELAAAKAEVSRLTGVENELREETVLNVAHEESIERLQAELTAKERERVAVLKCIEVILNTPVQLSDTGHAVHDHGQNTLLMAAARIRAEFPEASQEPIDGRRV